MTSRLSLHLQMLLWFDVFVATSEQDEMEESGVFEECSSDVVDTLVFPQC